MEPGIILQSKVANGKCKFTNLVRFTHHDQDFSKSIWPAIFLIFALIKNSGKTFFLGYRFEISPPLAGLEFVDSPAPLVILNKSWRQHSIPITQSTDGYWTGQPSQYDPGIKCIQVMTSEPKRTRSGSICSNVLSKRLIETGTGYFTLRQTVEEEFSSVDLAGLGLRCMGSLQSRVSFNKDDEMQYKNCPRFLTGWKPFSTRIIFSYSSVQLQASGVSVDRSRMPVPHCIICIPNGNSGFQVKNCRRAFDHVI